MRGPEIRRRQSVAWLAPCDSVCCAWDRDRGKAEGSGAGGGERQCFLCVGQR